MVLDLGGVRRNRPGGATPPDRSGARLLYEQVVDYVEKLISERGLIPGDLLPSYAELAELTGVSLITVRRALEELERAGKVRRHQGLGTFLARPRILTEPTRTGSLLETLAQSGKAQAVETLATKVLRMRRGLPPPDIAQALRIPVDAHVWQLRRQRMIDGHPAVIETSVIPVALAPGLDELVSELDGSLYDLLNRQFGLDDAYEEQYLEVIMPAQEERRLLSIPPRTYAVRIRGLSLDKAGHSFRLLRAALPGRRVRVRDLGFHLAAPVPDSGIPELGSQAAGGAGGGCLRTGVPRRTPTSASTWALPA